MKLSFLEDVDIKANYPINKIVIYINIRGKATLKIYHYMISASRDDLFQVGEDN